MQCPQCQQANRDGAQFCDQCGARLVHICPHCGYEGSPRATFCEECATPLAGYAAASRATLPTRQGTEAAARFQTALQAVMGLLQRDRRVLSRELTHIFGLDNVLLEEIREALIFKHIAIDEDGKGLVWTGETPPTVQLDATVPSQSATADVPAVTSPAAPPCLPLSLGLIRHRMDR